MSASAEICVVVNGTSRTFAANTTLAAVLETLAVPPTGIAVAVNGRVVRAAALADREVREGDAIEIIRAVSGG